MSFWQAIKRVFGKGAVAIGAKKELQSILDHPKIQMSREEYDRIQNSLLYYQGYTHCNSDQRAKANINMARKVASEYAKVMFNEQAEITIGKDDKSKKYDEASAWIESVFQHNDFKRNLSKYLE
ncbi:MAG: phage portal protein, partial [Enterococcus mundtii]|nr:phage portal protein [Enterococcus mundtii]